MYFFPVRSEIGLHSRINFPSLAKNSNKVDGEELSVSKSDAFWLVVLILVNVFIYTDISTRITLIVF